MKKLGKKLKQVVGAVAPLIGTAIGGPFGGVAASVLRAAFGTDDDAEIERQLAAASPDTLLLLKQAEKEFETKMAELEIEEEQLHAADRQDARKMATATTIIPQLVLTFLAIAAFGFVLYTLVMESAAIPTENKDIVIFLVGQLSTFTGMGFSFFLGSSKGSKDKADKMSGK